MSQDLTVYVWNGFLGLRRPLFDTKEECLQFLEKYEEKFKDVPEPTRKHPCCGGWKYTDSRQILKEDVKLIRIMYDSLGPNDPIPYYYNRTIMHKNYFSKPFLK